MPHYARMDLLLIVGPYIHTAIWTQPDQRKLVRFLYKEQTIDMTEFSSSTPPSPFPHERAVLLRSLVTREDFDGQLNHIIDTMVAGPDDTVSFAGKSVLGTELSYAIAVPADAGGLEQNENAGWMALRLLEGLERISHDEAGPSDTNFYYMLDAGSPHKIANDSLLHAFSTLPQASDATSVVTDGVVITAEVLAYSGKFIQHIEDQRAIRAEHAAEKIGKGFPVLAGLMSQNQVNSIMAGALHHDYAKQPFAITYHIGRIKAADEDLDTSKLPLLEAVSVPNISKTAG